MGFVKEKRLAALSSTLYITSTFDDTASTWASLDVKFPDTNAFENAAHSFLGWNQIIENQNPDLTVRIEHAFEDLKELEVITENLGDKKVNSRQHNDMTKSQWNQIPENIIDMLEDFCTKYKYESLKKRLKKLQ